MGHGGPTTRGKIPYDYEGLHGLLRRKMQDRVRDWQSVEHSCVVLDDCAGFDGNPIPSAIRALVLNGRTLNITALLAMPHRAKMPPCLCCNLDRVFLFDTPHAADRRRVYDTFAHGVLGSSAPSFELFCACMDRYASAPGRALVLCNVGPHRGLRAFASDFHGGKGEARATDGDK